MTRTVQLYGGGIDSLCIAHLWQPDVKVYFKIGTTEELWESAAAQRAGALLDDRLYLGDQVLPNKILPLRNLLLIGLASYYGNHILLGSTAGDTTRDKDSSFIDHCTDLLDYVLGHDPDKALPFHADGMSVEAPALRMTKTELVALYLREQGDPAALLASRSCYHGEHMECGTCRSCTRKYVALRLNGLHPVFASEPDLNDALAYAKARGRGKETSDIERLLK